ncbi:hypothetical protein HK096_010348, partial [Nowakowskiella sp. JEL0078]
MDRKQRSIFSHLRNRETAELSRNRHRIYQRKAYSYVYPKKTYYNVSGAPSGTIRKFSPDGKFLICFTKQQHAIQLFDYHGPRVQNSNTKLPSESLSFNRLFTSKYEVNITSGHEQLSKDFCLFTVDKKY